MRKSGLSALLWDYRYLLSFILIAIIYFFNMFIDIMEVDAAQYASMAREMMDSKNILEVYERGKDYLDKPPLLFWLSSASMNLFGVSDFAYKIPAVLVIILGIYSTYRFTLLFYTKQTAIFSALILSSSQAFFLITNDVRMDGILMGFVIFSIWQLSEYLHKPRFLYLLLAALGAAGALMSKGPIGLVIIGFAVGGGLMLKMDWKSVFKPQWLLFILMVAVFIAPMCYGLYTQFDLHPEKEAYGLTGPSGLKFFFWTQSFGRITGDIYWDNNTGFFYFFHSILWDFQPWILFFIPAFIHSIYKIIFLKTRNSEYPELMTLSGFTLSFLALSMSNYKLPHYIFPLFPFAAVITANYILTVFRIENNYFRYLFRVQQGFLFLFFILLAASMVFFFPTGSILFPSILVIFFVLFLFSLLKIKLYPDNLMISTLVSVLAFNLLLSIYFYPQLLKFQSGSVVGKEINRLKIPNDRFYIYGVGSHSLDFYAERITPSASMEDLSGLAQGTLVYTNQAGWDSIQVKKELNYQVFKSYDNYHVTAISLPFLNSKTRSSKLNTRYLLEKK